MTNDEGVLDPWVAEYFEADPSRNTVMDTLDPEILELARGDFSLPCDVEIASIEDADVEGIPIRIYRDDEPPTGLVVYFHGGGFVLGSIGIMENVAKELCHTSGAVVISVGYRLAPEDPYPAGLDDCETVTRWAIANASMFGVPASKVAIAGESAGGNLSATLALRLRDTGDVQLAGQVLIYPGTAGSQRFPSRDEFAGLVLNEKSMVMYWDAYTTGRDLDDDPYAAPLHAEHLRDLAARDRHPRRLRPAARRRARVRRSSPRGRRRRRGDLLPRPAPRLRQLRLPRRGPRPRGHRRLAPVEARRRLTASRFGAAIVSL